MTEEKAKEILGFLAKRSGYQTITLALKKNEFYVEPTPPDELWYLELCFHASEKTYIDDIHHLLNFKRTYLETTSFSNPISIGSCSFKAYLDKLLKLSRNGYDIRVFSYDWVFLKKNTNLENILVEMDLKTELLKEKQNDD